MTEKELINQLKKLQEIKPRNDWVVLTREQILNEGGGVAGAEEKISFISQFISVFNIKPVLKPVLAFAFCFCLLFGVFALSQNALPGDLFYSLKKAQDQIRLSLASEAEKPQVQIELTKNKLAELAKIAETNQGKNLAPAVEEVQQSLKETAQTIKKVAEAETDKKVVKDFQAKVAEIERQKEEVENILATKIEVAELDESINSYYQILVESELAELENKELTEEQTAIFNEAKELFEQAKYQEALEKILILSY